MHARTRHKMEYQSYLEQATTGGTGAAQLAAIERKLADLEALEDRLLKQAEDEEEKKRLNKERMAKAREARGSKRKT